MYFIVRSVELSDLAELYGLAKQASLVHLPADKMFLEKIIRKSVESFSEDIPPQDAVYLFVLEDLRNRKLIGTSQVIADYATEESPHYCYQVLEKKHFDEKLNIRICHQVLRLKKTVWGLSAIGGVVLDSEYRGHPDKLGKQIILTRFIYMGMFPERFGEQILSEFMAPVTEQGINPFWEALGKRFTGMSYKEFLFLLAQGNRNFIERLFPKEDIYMSLIDTDIHFSADRVDPRYGSFTKRVIKDMGLRYLNQIDFDGGVLYGGPLQKISVVKKGGFYKTERTEAKAASSPALMGVARNGHFRGGQFPCRIESQTVFLSDRVLSLLGLTSGEDIYLSPLE